MARKCPPDESQNPPGIPQYGGTWLEYTPENGWELIVMAGVSTRKEVAELIRLFCSKPIEGKPREDWQPDKIGTIISGYATRYKVHIPE